MSIADAQDLTRAITKQLIESCTPRMKVVPIQVVDLSTNRKYKMVAVVEQGGELMVCINPLPLRKAPNL